MSLTVSEVALIAAGIGLASPLIAFSTTARLDRERWIRQQRSDVYVEMIASYGHMARKASHQIEKYEPLPAEEWRLLQARVEALASDRILTIRDRYLKAWDRFYVAFMRTEGPEGSLAAAGDYDIEGLARAVRELYDELCATIRGELRARSLVRRP